jgi:hypothetical protein
LSSQAKAARVQQLAPSAKVRQIENRPSGTRQVRSSTPTYSHAFRHAQRRLALGFDDNQFLLGNTNQIISVIRDFRPNVIVNDYHDTVRIAADAADTPLISIAMAHGLRSGATLGAWKEHELGDRLLPDCLDSFNHVRSVFGLQPYQDERETFEGQLNMVPSCPVLDPLEQRATDIYVGPIVSPLAARKRGRQRPIVVSYLAEGNNRPSSSYPQALAQVIAAEHNVDFVVLGGARYAHWFDAGEVFRGMVEPGDYLTLIGDADLVITHGGTTLVHALERSVPVLCLPWTSSEAAWAVRTEEHGSGMLYPSYREPLEWRIDPQVHSAIPVAGHWSLEVTANGLRQAIRQILHEPGYRRAAIDLSQRLAVARAKTNLADVVEGIASR